MNKRNLLLTVLVGLAMIARLSAAPDYTDVEGEATGMSTALIASAAVIIPAALAWQQVKIGAKMVWRFAARMFS